MIKNETMSRVEQIVGTLIPVYEAYFEETVPKPKLTIKSEDQPSVQRYFRATTYQFYTHPGNEKLFLLRRAQGIERFWKIDESLDIEYVPKDCGTGMAGMVRYMAIIKYWFSQDRKFNQDDFTEIGMQGWLYRRPYVIGFPGLFGPSKESPFYFYPGDVAHQILRKGILQWQQRQEAQGMVKLNRIQRQEIRKIMVHYHYREFEPSYNDPESLTWPPKLPSMEVYK